MTKTKNIQNIFIARASLVEQQVCSPCISSKENQVEFQFYPLVLRVYDEQRDVPVREFKCRGEGEGLQSKYENKPRPHLKWMGKDFLFQNTPPTDVTVERRQEKK